MNEIPVITTTYDSPLLTLFSLDAVLLIGFFLAFRHWRRKQSIHSSPNTATLGNVALELGWLAAPIVVLATFMGISWMGSPPVVSTPAPFRSVMPMPMAAIPVSTDDRSTSASADGQAHRPAWVDQPSTNDGITEQLVIASQQYTTREEAEDELLASATKLLERDVLQLHPNAGQSTWKPSSDELRRVMVKQKYVEVVERDFGNFFHPMYRVWWQVELSPEVRTEFLPAWKQGLTNHRIRQVGVIAASLVLCASLITMNRRLNVLLRGAWSIVPRFLTCAVAVAWIVVMINQIRDGNF